MGYLYVSPGLARKWSRTQNTVSLGFSLHGARSCLRQGAGIAFDYGFEKHAFSDAYDLRLVARMYPLYEDSFLTSNSLTKGKAQNQ